MAIGDLALGAKTEHISHFSPPLHYLPLHGVKSRCFIDARYLYCRHGFRFDAGSLDVYAVGQ
jgi:hypothetical protein